MENHKEKLTISIEEYWQRDLPKVTEKEIELKLKSDLINIYNNIIQNLNSIRN